MGDENKNEVATTEKQTRIMDDTDAQLNQAKRIGKEALVQGLTMAATSWIVYQLSQYLAVFKNTYNQYKNQKKESE